MYALIINEKVEEYPVTRANLQKHYPRVSFPKELTDKIYTDYGCVKIELTEQPPYNQDEGQLVQVDPEFSEGKWVQKWSFIKFHDSVIAENLARKLSSAADAARQKRNTLLFQTDLDVIRSLEATNSIPENLKNYRQALRDLPAQEGFPSKITWPTKPS